MLRRIWSSVLYRAQNRTIKDVIRVVETLATIENRKAVYVKTNGAIN